MNRRTKTTLCLVMTLFIGRGPAPAPLAQDSMTLESVVEKHLEARGGREAWNRIQALLYEGFWEGFGSEAPLTIYQQRPGLYRFDYELFGAPTTFAYDGEKVWIQGAAMGVPHGQELTDAWKRNILDDAAWPQLVPAARRCGKWHGTARQGGCRGGAGMEDPGRCGWRLR